MSRVKYTLLVWMRENTQIKKIHSFIRGTLGNAVQNLRIVSDSAAATRTQQGGNEVGANQSLRCIALRTRAKQKLKGSLSQVLERKLK